MSDELFDLETTTDQVDRSPVPMSPAQRGRIRDLFAGIGITRAQDQFDLVEELTGVKIAAVSQLEAEPASNLIRALGARAERLHRPRTGNAWNDREEDTWIDRL